MTTTDTTTRRFLDVLPVRGGKRQALEWMPHSDDFAHGEGFVVLTSARDRTAYAVAQGPCDGPLLSFVFTKVGESRGTDAGRSAYLLTCTVNGNEAKCDCRGHQRWGWCRHSDALSTLFLNK